MRNCWQFHVQPVTYFSQVTIFPFQYHGICNISLYGIYPYYNEVPRYLLYQWVCNCLSVMLGSSGGIAVSSGLLFNTIGPRGLLLTHWGRVTHICVSKLTIISSDNGLSPGRRQAIIWTNAWILLIRTLGTNFSEILSEIHAFSFKKMHLKMSSGKRRPSCLGLNVLSHCLNNCWIIDRYANAH